MKKKVGGIIIIALILSTIFGLAMVSEAATYKCPNHTFKFTMTKVSSTATCTSYGYTTYTCPVCKLFGKTSTKVVYQPALGHNWGDDHTCTRCTKSMGGHWFGKRNSGYFCIVCNFRLTVTGMSPNLKYKTQYRAVPYDYPTTATGNITVTFNAIPYDKTGNLMSVAGRSTHYTAKNALYHWGKPVDKEILRNMYPPLFEGGKGINTSNTVIKNGSRLSGTRYSIPTSGESGKYVFGVLVGGSLVGSERLYYRGSTSSDDTPVYKQTEITIKHIDVDTNKEIVDKEYSKTVVAKGNVNQIFSLPIGTGTKYPNYKNVSYKIGNGSEIKNDTDSQYIVNAGDPTESIDVIFYYSSPKITINHIIENSGEEIKDIEYSKIISMTRPSTVTFSLDVENVYATLELVGYILDNQKTEIKTNKQYAVVVSWNNQNRNITYLYKYKELKVTTVVNHIDVTTGKLMEGTKEERYEVKPVSVTSLDLSKYTNYKNVGVYVDGKYSKKDTRVQYSVAIDTSGINYSREYKVIFYYDKTDNVFSYEMLNAIPSNLSPDEVAKIGSNTKDKEIYDVSKGMPTSENVYTNIQVYNYLLKYKYQRVTDIKESNIKFVQPYKINNISKTIETTYSVPAIVQYYKLLSLEVYNIETATVVNEILPGGKITIPSNSSVPNITYTVPEKYIVSNVETNKTITLPELQIAAEKFMKSEAGNMEYAKHEATEDIEVRNDTLIIDGVVITNDELCKGITKEPNKFLTNKVTNSLYKNGITIGKNIKNGNYASTGTVTYVRCKNINGTLNEKLSFDIKPNEVIVHTPVVANITLDNTNALLSNQKINLATKVDGIEAKILVLNEKFKVTIRNSGTHNDYKGYGTRAYNYGQGVNKTSYAVKKQIKMPFDIYLIRGTNKILIKANTWYDLPVNEEDFEFSVPSWVLEGAYDKNGNQNFIETRVIAENYGGTITNEKGEAKANKSITNYMATDKIFVEVVGRLTDLQIVNSTDSNFKLESPLNVSKIPIGQYGQSKLGTKYAYAIKLGYSAEFNVKTLGKKSNGIGISNTKFLYVDKTTNEIQEVDLYYRVVGGGVIKVGSAEDKRKLEITTDGQYINDSCTWSGEYKLPASTIAITKGASITDALNKGTNLKNGYIIVQIDVNSTYNTWDYLSYNKPNSNTQWEKENYSRKVSLPNGKEVTLDGVGSFIVYEANIRANNDYESTGTH